MKQYIIANWKMNGTQAEAKNFSDNLLKHVSEAIHPLPHIILCPSYPYLLLVNEIFKNSPLKIGAQNIHQESKGAFTGDVSAFQARDVGCSYVIIGHSERRQWHHETSPLIQKKLETAIKSGLRPILCVGESHEERIQGKALQIISNQLASELPTNITANDLLIAYEPLWAIGTGLTPTLAEIEEVMGFLKYELSQRITRGALIPTLYGGSVTALNAGDFLKLKNVDGLLVGGASLNAEEFWQIINQSKDNYLLIHAHALGTKEGFYIY